MTAERLIVPPASGIGVRLKKGDELRVINEEGGQTGDLLAYSLDGADPLSNGRSFDYNGKIYLSAGDTLWSSGSRRMLTILEDEAGRHDFLYAPCSIEMYRMQYGTTDDHPNCTDNLRGALRGLGIEPGALPVAFNLFMVADVGPDGRLTIGAPNCPPGTSIRFRAEMDLAVAVSSCPAGACNGGEPLKPLVLEVLRDSGRAALSPLG